MIIYIIKLMGLGFGAIGLSFFLFVLWQGYHGNTIKPIIGIWEKPFELPMYIIGLICAILGFIWVAIKERGDTNAKRK